MDEENRFEPVLGRIRASPSGRGRSYLRRVLAAAAAAGTRRSSRSGRFDGSRVGRGAGIGRLLGGARRFGGLRGRRAMVKTRLVRLGTKGLGGARAHLRYIQRDGVERDGARGTLFGREPGAADGGEFLERCAGDRHQFRLILSPEDGAQYDGLELLVRRFMDQMERDLGTQLDWVAAEHRDTGRPHAHVILRGKDERGANLVIAREYIAAGMRERLAELVTRDLGPRQDREVEQTLREEITAERLTGIDRRLLRDRHAAGLVRSASRDPFWQVLRTGRLRHLERLGLASRVGQDCWRIGPGAERMLRTLGERGDIIRTMQRELGRAGLERSRSDWLVHDFPLAPGGLVGRVVARGLLDEHSDTHFLLVDGTDGRVHHLPIGGADAVEPLLEGAIVRALPAAPRPRKADRVIAAIAEDAGGVYSADLHRAHDPQASDEHIAAHVRRLEAVRRGSASVSRAADGSWTVGEDYLERAAAHERSRMRRAPVRVDLLSAVSLEQLAGREAATFLDRELGSADPLALRDAGFGRELKAALDLRRRWLIGRGLAREKGEALEFAPGALANLRRRELAAAAVPLSRELGLAYAETEEGSAVNGRLLRRIDLASGRFALVELGREFTLVPWRPVLERQIGREVSGMVRRSGISWAFSRGRSIGF